VLKSDIRTQLISSYAPLVRLMLFSSRENMNVPRCEETNVTSSRRDIMARDHGEPVSKSCFYFSTITRSFYFRHVSDVHITLQ